MPADSPRVETLFHRAKAFSPAERAAFLDAACADDADLRARVDRLLAAHDELGEFLHPQIPVEPTTGDYRDEPHRALEQPEKGLVGPPHVGTIIAGKYKLIEEIGEGGMGSVWMAQQTEPVKRTVAIKLIKAGMDSKAVLARFEAERQALALMDHPNIAKVLDAGATPDSRPFFVMELVKGIPITQFCDDRRLTPRERLELFVPVCQAIQHAHQKGIIHRDIKPNNVLVALYDDRPVPKVIDFGVAKAAGQPLTEKTLATGFGAVVGTPEYMSPEQAGFNNLDIDTRSDVYALGALLYELLAGSPPFARKELHAAGLLEILRVIREQEPQKPSTKLSTADALPTLSANRGTEPRRLAALIRGELDWIVMKSLEKDRNRRYESANEFAADLQRYLAGEPVTAVPPSTGYQLRKFLHRNRGPVLAATVVFLALAVGIIGTTWGLIRADAARREEADQRQTAERLRVESDTQRARAEDQRRLAEQRAAGLVVDSELQDLWSRATREGLVRLATTLKNLPPDSPALRQAVVANLLVWGQEIAPFYSLDAGRPFALSPGGRTAIVEVEGNWEVRDILSGHRLATLSQNAMAGLLLDDGAMFSGDGTHAVTVEKLKSGGAAIRVWDTSSWTEVTQIRTPHQPSNRVIVNRDGSRVAANVAVEPRPRGASAGAVKQAVYLWNGRSGQLVARLDRTDPRNELLEFSPDGRLILFANESTAVLVSAEDGRVLHTLRGHANTVAVAAFSPSGNWLAIGAHKQVYWWNVQTGTLLGSPVEIAAVLYQGDGDEIVRFAFTAEDALIVRVWNMHGVSFGRNVGAAVCVRGHAQSYKLDAVSSDGRYVLTDDGLVYALNPLRRLETPPARRFPPEVHQAAAGKRFVQLGNRLVDLMTERPVGSILGHPAIDLQPLDARGCALVLGFRGYYGPLDGYRLVPAPDLNLSDEALMLWANTIARGHLDPDTGLFIDDDETTWERNRQRLFSSHAPVGDFPFPGPFAGDKHFWLRQALKEEQEPAKQLALVDRLILVEPSWQNYQRRAFVLYVLNRYADSVRSDLKAREIGGGDYHQDTTSGTNGGSSSAAVIVLHDDYSKDDYELAMKFLKMVGADQLDSQQFHQTLYYALALHRLGRSEEALRVLNRLDLQTAGAIAGSLTTPFALLVAYMLSEQRRQDHREYTIVRVIESLCYRRLGQPDRARQSIDRARAAIRHHQMSQRADLEGGWDFNPIVTEALRGIEKEK